MEGGWEVSGPAVAPREGAGTLMVVDAMPQSPTVFGKIPRVPSVGQGGIGMGVGLLCEAGRLQGER